MKRILEKKKNVNYQRPIRMFSGIEKKEKGKSTFITVVSVCSTFVLFSSLELAVSMALYEVTEKKQKKKGTLSSKRTKYRLEVSARSTVNPLYRD